MADPLVIGLTGGIASGKSTVADRFAHHGIEVIDTDRIAREVVRPGQPGLEAIVKRFGPAIVDAEGRLDRAALRRRVFADPAEREALEAILHPLIRERLWQRVAQAGSAYVIAVVPLLIETGLHRQVDRVLVVDVDPAIQRQRLMARDGSTDEEVDAILAAQAPRGQRLELADDCIRNDADLAALHRQVDELHARYLERAASGAGD